MAVEKKDKAMRSLRLEQSVNEKLQAICDAFGVTANAYIVGELGKAIHRDYMTINAQKNNDEMTKQMISIFQNSFSELENNK